ncbi:hypothetical protein C8J56DRAFT_974910 [Mycena floridula]|nr:hypothetical protein C8J56DRAFT_974910 [Mycena floridula]
MAPRKSGRIKQPASKVVVTADGDDDDDDDEFIAEPTKKRRKTAAKPKAAPQTSNRGLLQRLVDSPVDILYEVFSCLESLDLLRLTRTSKSLRSMLLTKRALSVWRDARGNAELPDPPAGLSEPLYANLVFGGRCHHCFSLSPQIFWCCRFRCCNKCAKKLFHGFRPAPQGKDDLSKVLNVLAEIWVIETREMGDSFQYYIPALDRAILEYRALEDQPARDGWLERKAEEKKVVVQWALSCQDWSDERAESRLKKIEATKARRYETILKELTELGWDMSELSYSDRNELMMHSDVDQAKDLTEQTWYKIKPGLVELMRELKDQRLQAADKRCKTHRYNVLSLVYAAYRKEQPMDSIIPPIVDVALAEPFRVIIEDTPMDQNVSMLDLEPAVVELPRITQEWRTEKQAELLAILQKEHDEDATLAYLALAKTMFKVSSSGCSAAYPDILVEESLSFKPGRYSLHSAPQMLNATSWNAMNCISFDFNASDQVSDILELCSLDPDITTRHELDELNPFFECKKCQDDSGRLFMPWARAINHRRGHQLSRASDDDEEAASRLVAARRILPCRPACPLGTPGCYEKRSAAPVRVPL